MVGWVDGLSKGWWRVVVDGGWVGGLSKGWWGVVVDGWMGGWLVKGLVESGSGWLDGWVACQRVGGEW